MLPKTLFTILIAAPGLMMSMAAPADDVSLAFEERGLTEGVSTKPSYMSLAWPHFLTKCHVHSHVHSTATTCAREEECATMATEGCAAVGFPK